MDVVETLKRVMDQVEKDLASAHAEIVKLQGGDPAGHVRTVATEALKEPT